MPDSDRRELSFANLNEVVVDIEAIANSAHRTSGKQTFAQIVQHFEVAQTSWARQPLVNEACFVAGW